MWPAALVAIKTEADEHEANVLPIIREVQKVGGRTLRQSAVARWLLTRRFQTIGKPRHGV
jgi:hypothetical protein